MGLAPCFLFVWKQQSTRFEALFQNISPSFCSVILQPLPATLILQVASVIKSEFGQDSNTDAPRLRQSYIRVCGRDVAGWRVPIRAGKFRRFSLLPLSRIRSLRRVRDKVLPFDLLRLFAYRAIDFGDFLRVIPRDRAIRGRSVIFIVVRSSVELEADLRMQFAFTAPASRARRPPACRCRATKEASCPA